MPKWDYGDAYLRHPCQGGTVVFDNESKLRVCDLTLRMPDFMRKADALFIDPPWNQGNITSFYTKAEQGHTVAYGDFLTSLFERIREIAPRVCYLEMGKDHLADALIAMRRLFPNVTFYNSTYYHKPGNLCYIIRGGRKRPVAKLDGMDEEDVISWICANEDYNCIGDLCMGRGLVGVGAYKNGRRFVGTELNHKRLSVLLERITQMGGTYRIKEDHDA